MSVQVRAQRNTVSVNFTQKTTVSEILSSAIKKLKLKGSYSLSYRGKPLNNSSTLRQAGISQGCVLDLVRQKKSQEQTKIALQLPNRKRVAAEFLISATLWEILVYFEEMAAINVVSKPDEAYSYPILAFMNRTISSISDLKCSSIASLGAQGSLFRLSLGTATGKTPRELGLLLEQEVPAEKKQVSSQKPNEVEKKEEKNDKDSVPIDKNVEEKEEEEKTPDIVEEPLNVQPVTKESYSEIQSKDEETSVPEENLSETEVTPPQEEEKKIESETTSAEIENNIIPDKKKPEETKEEPKEKLQKVVKKIERELQYFSPTSQSKVRPPEYYSDDVFQLRPSDLKGTKSEVVPPFEREKQKKKLAKKFEIVNIRVIFPDRQAIQARFAVKERVRDIYTVVKDCLADQTLEFELFTPPKTVLNKQNTLFKEQLYPSANVNLRWKNSDSTPSPLFKADIKFTVKEPEPEKEEPQETQPPPKKSPPKQKRAPATQAPKKVPGGAPKWFMAGKKF